MRYVCSVCGYVYDEAKEGKAFAELPDSWVCPLCGAAKSAFSPEEKTAAPKPPVNPIRIHEDMRKLSAGELARLGVDERLHAHALEVLEGVFPTFLRRTL